MGACSGGEFVGEVFVDLADASGVGEGAWVVHAVGHGEVFGVVGDGDEAEASTDGGFGHLADGAGTVGLGGVHVDVAVDVGQGDEVREQRAGGRDILEAHLSRR